MLARKAKRGKIKASAADFQVVLDRFASGEYALPSGYQVTMSTSKKYFGVLGIRKPLPRPKVRISRGEVVRVLNRVLHAGGYNSSLNAIGIRAACARAVNMKPHWFGSEGRIASSFHGMVRKNPKQLDRIAHFKSDGKSYLYIQ